MSPPDASDWSVNYKAEVSNLIFSLSKNCVRPASFPVILGEFRCNVGTQFQAFSLLTGIAGIALDTRLVYDIVSEPICTFLTLTFICK